MPIVQEEEMPILRRPRACGPNEGNESLPSQEEGPFFFQSAPTATEATSTLWEEAGAASSTSMGTTKRETAIGQASKEGTIRTKTMKAWVWSQL